jgi:hypothetical protein
VDPFFWEEGGEKNVKRRGITRVWGREKKDLDAYAALLSLQPHSMATWSKSGASLVDEFLMHETRTWKSDWFRRGCAILLNEDGGKGERYFFGGEINVCSVSRGSWLRFWNDRRYPKYWRPEGR